MPLRREEFDLSSAVGRISSRDVAEVADPTLGVLWNNLSVNWEAWTLGWGN
jgi:hypothetical protein